MNKLQIQVLLGAVDKMTAPLRSVESQTRKFSQALNENKEKLKALEKAQNQMGSFGRVKSNIEQSAQSIQKYASKIDTLKEKHETLKLTRDKLIVSIKDHKRKVDTLLSRQKALAISNQANSSEYAELTAQINRANFSIYTMENSLQQSKRALSDNKKSLNAEKAALKASRHEKAKQLVELRRLRQKLKESGIDVKRLGTNEIITKNKIRETTKEIEKQRKALERLNKTKQDNERYKKKVQFLKSGSDRLANLGQKSMVTGAAGIGLLAKPTTEFASAEKAAINLKVAMMDKNGEVSKDYEKINQLATNLGNKLPGTTADFKELMTMLIRQGVSTEAILGGTGEAAAYLSVQLGMAPAAAAEFAAKMQDATRTTEANMMDLMDIIQKGFYAGVDPTNMLGAYKNLGSAMDLIKMKGIEGAKAFAPFVAMFDQAGMDGSSQGNAMRKVLQKSMDTQKIQKALIGLRKEGLLPKNFKLNFTNGKGEFGGFDNLFKQLDKLKGLNSEARLAVIKDIFGDDAEVNQVLSVLIEKGKAGYEEFAEKMERQAALRKRVDEQLASLANIWDAASGTFTNLLVEIGTTFAPQLKALAEQFGQLSEQLISWVKANPELVGSIAKVIAICGAAMIVIGSLSTLFSYTLYPIARLGLFLWKIVPAIISVVKLLGGTLLSAITLVGKSLFLMGKFLLANPIFLVIGLIAGAAYLIYKNWEPISNFFKEIWDDVERIFDDVKKWFTNLPAEFSQYGTNMIESLKKGIEDKFKAVTNFIKEKVDWIKEKLGFSTEAETKITEVKEKTEKAMSKAMTQNNTGGQLFMAGTGIEPEQPKVPNKNSWSGGYAGNGGKYQPKGIFHGGEYIMTKEATSRLGVPLLNALNYGKNAMLAAGLGVSVASAQPIKVDNRPPLSAKSQTSQMASQPMQVTININAQQGQSAVDIAKEVEKALRNLENQKQARARSTLRDRD
ncbi:phage tail tape measure protein [Avibacterium avium]|uniref:phage tail tape measure protein n=1 Tax=Avibacterium avium TaxID=751 RepID=UPI003BF8CA30